MEEGLNQLASDPPWTTYEVAYWLFVCHRRLTIHPSSRVSCKPSTDRRVAYCITEMLPDST